MSKEETLNIKVEKNERYHDDLLGEVILSLDVIKATIEIRGSDCILEAKEHLDRVTASIADLVLAQLNPIIIRSVKCIAVEHLEDLQKQEEPDEPEGPDEPSSN